MSKSVRIVGLNNFVRDVNRISKQVENEVSQEIRTSSLRVESSAKKLAPFDTGWLANNIYSKMLEKSKAEVVSPAHYSIYLEYGTRKMREQPFLGPAVKAEEPVLLKNLERIVNK